MGFARHHPHTFVDVAGCFQIDVAVDLNSPSHAFESGKTTIPQLYPRYASMPVPCRPSTTQSRAHLAASGL